MRKTETDRQTDRQRERQTDRDRETLRERNRDRQTDRQRQTERQTETERHREKETETDRQTDRQTDRDRNTERDREREQVGADLMQWTDHEMPDSINVCAKRLGNPEGRRRIKRWRQPGRPHREISQDDHTGGTSQTGNQAPQLSCYATRMRAHTQRP